VTDLEIEEAIREAWAVLSAASPSARRLTVLADQGAWLASWGPRPGEPNCRVPPALLPETQARHENAYALWRSAVRTSDEVASESKTPRMRTSRSRRQTDAGGTSPERPKTRRGKTPAREPGGG
jgi:hypothetical protein